MRKPQTLPFRGVLSVGLVGAILLCFLASVGTAQGLNGDPVYTTGPKTCVKCHEGEYWQWMSSGHSRKLGAGSLLNFALGENFGLTSSVPLAGFPLPDHDPNLYNWNNILFVIGSSKYWKTRYVDMTGHVITKNGKNQYNWATSTFVDYEKDKVKPFSCGPCHTTGHRPMGTAFAGVPGIVGDFAHFNVTCEACHGGSTRHNQTQLKSDIVVDKSAALCGKCHTRGSNNNVIIAKGGFIKHHEQYPEMLSAKHRQHDCVECHDPHKPRGLSIKLAAGQTEICNKCHSTELWDYIGSKHQQAGVKCQDCHMARATKSATALGRYEGDVRTHIFKIDSSANYWMFNAAGDQAKGALSLEFTCMPCHNDKTKQELASIGTTGKVYHEIGKTGP